MYNIYRPNICGYGQVDEPCPDGTVMTPNGCKPWPSGDRPPLPGWVVPGAIIVGASLFSLAVLAASKPRAKPRMTPNRRRKRRKRR